MRTTNNDRKTENWKLIRLTQGADGNITVSTIDRNYESSAIIANQMVNWIVQNSFDSEPDTDQKRADEN